MRNGVRLERCADFTNEPLPAYRRVHALNATGAFIVRNDGVIGLLPDRSHRSATSRDATNPAGAR